MESIYSVRNIGDSTGVISILTKNAVVRSKPATLMALTKILNYELYSRWLI